MKRARLILLVIIAIAATAAVVWQTGLYKHLAKLTESRVVDKAPADNDEPPEEWDEEGSDEPNEADKPDESEKPGEAEKPDESKKPGEPNEPNEPNEPGEPMEALNLKDVQMKDIIKKLADWTGKVIIPHDDVMKLKVTIYSKEKVPRSEALALLFRVLSEKGFVAEHTDNALYLKPKKDVKLRSVPTIPADQPLGALANKDEIVQKFFKLKNYSPVQLEKVVAPLMPEHGYVSAIESTNHLVVIDTVLNLMRIERIIAQLDVPETQETVTHTFEIEDGDPVEIVELLNLLLGDGDTGRSRSSSNRSSSRNRDRNRPGGNSNKPKSSSSAPSVIIGPSNRPVTLIPITKRKWIIAKASAEDMALIEEWIGKLDQKKPEEREHTLRQIQYADVTELAEQITVMIEQMPGRLRANVMVQPLNQTKQVMIMGSAENREMIEKLIDEIDVPTERFQTEHIKLEHADPEQIKQNLEALYEEVTQYSYSSSYGRSRSSRRRSRATGDPDMVRVIAYPALKQITVIASADNMVKIKEQVKEWDQPIDVNSVAPMIIQLKNSDPVAMTTLLTGLFTETERRFTWRDYIYGSGGVTKTIVGPLYGQMTFEAVPDTKKIIVISKIPEGYEVVKKLVEQLDKEEMAEVPMVIPLEYADPEDLSERLNAVFNEAGTTARIRLRARGFTQTGMQESSDEESGSGSDSGSSSSSGEYTPPWSGGGARARMGEQPISNVIGRIRFIPDPHSKSILVLTPPEFLPNIKEMIKDLDKPGRQVRIKAIILSINHDDVTSLGVQLASNALPFGILEENALIALTSLADMQTHGTGTLDMSMNVTSLVDFLIRKTDAKILNQQALWTKDNEEASFFKGEEVAFSGDISVSDTGSRVTSGVTYEFVGMTLRVRPNITPQKNVDMNIDLTISQLTSELINDQPVRTRMNTTTTAIVQNGQTIMLGGILFQEESVVERKIALLGDLPGIGGLFRHTETVDSNNELIIFITPEVLDLADLEAESQRAEERLNKALEELNNALDKKGL